MITATFGDASFNKFGLPTGEGLEFNFSPEHVESFKGSWRANEDFVFSAMTLNPTNDQISVLALRQMLAVIGETDPDTLAQMLGHRLVCYHLTSHDAVAMAYYLRQLGPERALPIIPQIYQTKYISLNHGPEPIGQLHLTVAQMLDGLPADQRREILDGPAFLEGRTMGDRLCGWCATNDDEVALQLAPFHRFGWARDYYVERKGRAPSAPPVAGVVAAPAPAAAR
jgi:hypothetical protein